MSERSSEIANQIGSPVAKIAAGAGIGLFGVLTLQDWVMITGIACSVVITLHTLWRWAVEWVDRRAAKRRAR